MGLFLAMTSHIISILSPMKNATQPVRNSFMSCIGVPDNSFHAGWSRGDCIWCQAPFYPPFRLLPFLLCDILFLFSHVGLQLWLFRRMANRHADSELGSLSALIFLKDNLHLPRSPRPHLNCQQDQNQIASRLARTATEGYFRRT